MAKYYFVVLSYDHVLRSSPITSDDARQKLNSFSLNIEKWKLRLKSNKFKTDPHPKITFECFWKSDGYKCRVQAHFCKLLLWKNSFIIFRVILNWGHVILSEVLNIASKWSNSISLKSLSQALESKDSIFRTWDHYNIYRDTVSSCWWQLIWLFLWEFSLLLTCFTVVNGLNHWILLLLRAFVR